MRENLRFVFAAIFLLVNLFAASIATAAPAEIDVIVSVDWEGEDLLDLNLQAMEEFRREFPRIPLVQFLNAAYYTAPGSDPDVTTAKIRRGLGACDEIGLHIHGWQDLFEASFRAAGLNSSSFKDSPAFWGPRSQPLGREGRRGHDVPIKEYSTRELRAVVRFSLQTLRENGFQQPIQSFRAGGWMADGNVFEAITSEGFRVESSAITPAFLQARIDGSPLFTYVNELWGPGGLHPTEAATAPYSIFPGLIEVPGALFADYVTDADLPRVLEPLLEQAGDARPILHLSFHQETAAQFLHVMRGILYRMDSDYTKARRIKFNFRTLTRTACN